MNMYVPAQYSLISTASLHPSAGAISNAAPQTQTTNASSSKDDRHARSVFVGNIPYEATEEELKEIFNQAGPVLSFRLVFDRETGKPKGYGFCEYKDIDTAQSAMRNLNGAELHGRSLRVDSAASEKNREEPRVEIKQEVSPYGPPVPPEQAPEAITQAVASLPPEQMFELMKQMKVCIQNNPEEARQMLIQNPQLSYALLQAQVIMKIVDPSVAQTILYRNRGEPVPTNIPLSAYPEAPTASALPSQPVVVPAVVAAPVLDAGLPTHWRSLEPEQRPAVASLALAPVNKHEVRGVPPLDTRGEARIPSSMEQWVAAAVPTERQREFPPEHHMREMRQPTVVDGRHTMMEMREPAPTNHMDVHTMETTEMRVESRDPRDRRPGGPGGMDMIEPRGPPHLSRDPRERGREPHDVRDPRGAPLDMRDPRGPPGMIRHDPREPPRPGLHDPRMGVMEPSHQVPHERRDPRMLGDPRHVDSRPPDGRRPLFDHRGGPPQFDDRAPMDARDPRMAPNDPRFRPSLGGPGLMGIGPGMIPNEDQAKILMHVMNLSEQDMAMLPEEQRHHVLMLRDQVRRGAL